MSALFNFTGYENFVLENKIKSELSTKLDMNPFMTIDYSLAEHPGMKKIIHTYKATSDSAVDDLARGNGNTHFIEAEYTSNEYEVARTQGQTRYYDDDLYTDPTLIDAKIQYLTEFMVNNWKAKAIKEFDKSENTSVMTNWGLADWADALAKYANVHESEADLFCICSIDLVPTIRKALGNNLEYVEPYMRTGAIGAILGVPLYMSKAIPKGLMFVADKKAVTAFMKQDVRVEQQRDPDTKLNKIFSDRYTVIALTDESRCIKCGKAQATEATVTTATKATKTIAGAIGNGVKVTAFVNGEKTGSVATGANGAYSITADENLVAGDKVYVIGETEGFLPSKSEVFTVAE